MRKPIVAVVGRPNVGKSTFFNKICGKRISIVDDSPGVTRDRIYADAEWVGHSFTLVDTGGLDERSEDIFQKDIKKQALIAINEADVIVFLVDGRVGVTPNDEEVAEILQKSKTPVVLVVNKLDNFDVEKTYEFYSLGLGEPYPLSVMQSKGLGDVLDAVVKNFKQDVDLDESKETKIAIVGRPNVGKSSLVNRLIGSERVVVSNIEGTTRDSVLVPFKYNKKDYALVDTAGLRRQRSVEKVSVEGYSVLRTMSAIDESDVSIIVVDGSQDMLSEQDVRVAGYVHEAGKPSVIVVNKWDIKSKSKPEYELMLKEALSFMSYFEVIFVSALTGTSTGQIMGVVEKVYENASKRITTGLLNELLHDAILNFEPPARSGRRAKIRYITQASTNPPTFVLFVNEPKLINFSYERYLENRFRERIDFSGTPIKFVLKGKGEE
ncbi:MAG: ribosome biogenesis GTPase Der [Clostridiales bacterium]|nr:ribosome biogenesis GTPase Der [Clostridiales bacterium]